MARQRVPPEVRGRQWAEGTIWEMLVAAQALPYRLSSPLADLGMTASQRRRLHQEVELLKTTRAAYILPRAGSARRPPQLWLYVRARRSGYYRANAQGVIEGYGKRTQRLGAGSVTEHGWYPCSLRVLLPVLVTAQASIIVASTGREV
jgi:hypothetical protein